jgi:hypothetical protein
MFEQQIRMLPAVTSKSFRRRNNNSKNFETWSGLKRFIFATEALMDIARICHMVRLSGMPSLSKVIASTEVPVLGGHFI